MSSTDEELDLSEIDVFATRKRKAEPKSRVLACATADTLGTTVVRMEEKLAIASLEASSLRQRNKRSRSEQRRMARMKRRQQQASTTEGSTSEDQQKWQEVRPFLTVNDHLEGPVPHGSCGPKTELESLVEAAIADGDFEKAEMLSDHLANRQFAVKIADAFAAKRCAEEQEAKSRRDYVKRQAKLPWGFEAKERWQMKGNM
uniref:Protein FAM204A n=1 Tax=Rhipicephalus appendiculatus TaxID=34631 RepID=A0A131YLQ6_RHIAP